MPEEDTTLSDFGFQVSKKKVKLTKYGIMALFGYSIAPPIILGLVIFLSAGHTDLPRAWLFLAALLVIGSVSAFLQYKTNPALLNHRGAWKKKQGTKSWDRIIMPVYGMFHFYTQCIVIGLDVGRYQWSSLGVEWAVIGLLMYIVSAVILAWSMLANPFFEATVRIQKERHQRVISTGPYKYIRHPQNLGIIIFSFPFCLYVPFFNDLGIKVGDIFSWMLFVLLIIIYSDIEEIFMLKKYPDKYGLYKANTGFFIPSIIKTAIISINVNPSSPFKCALRYILPPPEILNELDLSTLLLH